MNKTNSLASESSSDFILLESLLKKGEIQQAQKLLAGFLPSDTKDALLRELAFRKKILAQSARKIKKINTVRCPKCSSPARFYDIHSNHVTCKQCQTYFSPLGEDLGANKFLVRKSFFQLGMIGTLNKKKYQIIGIASYKINGYERENDDGWSYNHYVFNYTEYTLLSEDKQYLYIEESTDGYFVSHKTLFKNPSLPQFSVDKKTTETALTLDIFTKGKQQIIKEYGVITRLGSLGESSYIPQENERISFVSMEQSQTRYEVEWRSVLQDGKTEEILEVENYESSRINLKDIYEGFGLQKELQAYHKQKKRAYKKIWYALYLFLSGCGLLLFGLLVSAWGNTVVSQNISGQEITEAGYVIGPFELNEVGRLHTIALSGSRPNNKYYTLGVDILDQDKDVIRATELDVWHESGRDSDGRWSEQLTSIKKNFNLSKAGMYYLELFQWRGTGAAQSVNISLREKTYSPIYLWVFGGISLLLSYFYFETGQQILRNIERGQITQYDIFWKKNLYITIGAIIAIIFFSTIYN